jgi:hypothetical protein
VGALGFQWNVGGTSIAGSSFDTLRISTQGLYGIRVDYGRGCTATDTITIRKDTSLIPILSPLSLSICEGSEALLTCSPGFVRYTFEWIKDEVAMIPATPTSNLRYVKEPGAYKVRVTNTVGCVIITDTAIVSYYPKSVKPFIIRKDPVLSLSTTAFIYYQWYKNGKVIVGANATTYRFSSDGTYFAIVTDKNGCEYASDTIEIQKLSIKPALNEMDIRLYPNPTQNVVYIEAPIQMNAVVSDMLGKPILELKDAKSINLENYADGCYTIRLSDKEGNYIRTEKIMKTTP